LKVFGPDNSNKLPFPMTMLYLVGLCFKI